MPFDDVYVISDKLDVATEDQIRVAEATLGTHFPAGYRDYIMTLGAGYLNGRVRVVPPAEIVDQTAEFQDRLRFVYGGTEAESDSFDLFEAGGDPFDLFEAGPTCSLRNGCSPVSSSSTPGTGTKSSTIRTLPAKSSCSHTITTASTKSVRLLERLSPGS